MKLKICSLFAVGILCAFHPASIWAQTDSRARQPLLDADGRFWVYRNGLAHPVMPFAPYGWMSDVTNLTQLIKIDLLCSDNPNRVMTTSGPSEKDSCIRVMVTWGDATWASIAFISGPDKPPWWGDTAVGRHYNLASLPKKKLIFYARGDHGGETIKAQIGVLGDKPYGDSLKKPVTSEEIPLTQTWTRHEVDLSNVPAAELDHVCNGFGVTVERDNQAGSPTETVFYLDDIYFE